MVLASIYIGVIKLAPNCLTQLHTNYQVVIPGCDTGLKYRVEILGCDTGLSPCELLSTLSKLTVQPEIAAGDVNCRSSSCSDLNVAKFLPAVSRDVKQP